MSIAAARWRKGKGGTQALRSMLCEVQEHIGLILELNGARPTKEEGATATAIAVRALIVRVDEQTDIVEEVNSEP